jgi:acetolactate synthase-1/2/3 large subunit
VTGLATANSEGDPVVALGGAVATAEALKQIHQTMDSVSILKPVTKFSAAFDCRSGIQRLPGSGIRPAGRGVREPAEGHHGRRVPGRTPVTPCLHRLWPGGHGQPSPGGSGPTHRCGRESGHPAGLLASRPVNAAAVQDFVGRSNLAVVGTFQAAGAISAQLFDNFGGRVGQIANQPADRLLGAADLVITICYDAVEYDPSIWNGSSRRKIVHVDAQQADIEACYCPSVELIGDIAQTLKALTPMLKRSHRAPISSAILQAIAADRKQFSEQAARLNGTPIPRCASSMNCKSC